MSRAKELVHEVKNERRPDVIFRKTRQMLEEMSTLDVAAAFCQIAREWAEDQACVESLYSLSKTNEEVAKAMERHAHSVTGGGS